MKARLFLASAAPLLVALTGRVQSADASLIGTPTPAHEAVPVPETTWVQAISDDGRRLLFTSASERLAPDDHNQASDAFLFDHTTGSLTLVSVGATGQSGDGASLAGGMTADAGRAVFLSRAASLVGAAPDKRWGVFVRDFKTGTTLPGSPGAKDSGSAGSTSDPLISRDGRYVLHRSADPTLAPGGVFAAWNLYRRDLTESRTECVSTNLPPGLSGTWRLTSFAASPDAGNVAMTAYAVSGANRGSAVIWRDLAGGQPRNCTTTLPPELAGSTLPSHTEPAISADGQFVAFRSELSIAGGRLRYALSLYNVQQQTTAVLCLRTNGASASDPVFPRSAMQAQVSADARYVAYATPTPANPALPAPQRVTLPFQVYLYEPATGTTRLVSAAPDGITPANADAVHPQLAPDGRGVAFLSRATNLLAGLADTQLRAFWYDRETGHLTVVADLGDWTPEDARLALSPNGDWLAASAPGEAGAGRFHVFDTRNRTTTVATIAPQFAESSTGRGWLGVRPEGISADGRYVALTGFAPAPADEFAPMQAYLVDTLTGARRLATEGVDGQLGNGHVTPPSLSADGTRLLVVTAASNFAAEDTNGVADTFVQNLTTGQRQLLRGADWPVRAAAQPDALLSPDGSCAALSFLDNRTVWQLAATAGGAVSPRIPGTVVDAPVFSGDGSHFAVCRSPATTGQAAGAVEVYATSDWLDGRLEPPPPRWASSIPARAPSLSARGSRVAFLLTASGAAPGLSNTVVVADYDRGVILWSNRVQKAAVSRPTLSADGRHVAWVSPGSSPDGINQVWRAEVDSGAVTLVSSAMDGTSEGNGPSKSAVISADGHYVAFASLADNLVANDTNAAKDVFLRDVQTGQTLLVSHGASGTASHGWSHDPFFSADGRSLFFLSHAPDVAARDANQAVDLFKVEILADSRPLLVIRRNLATGQAQVLWSGAPGKTYRLESTEALGAAWTSQPGEYMGDTVVEVNSGEAARRFYRLREL